MPNIEPTLADILTKMLAEQKSLGNGKNQPAAGPGGHGALGTGLLALASVANNLLRCC